jgi:hypothetical protein
VSRFCRFLGGIFGVCMSSCIAGSWMGAVFRCFVWFCWIFCFFNLVIFVNMEYDSFRANYAKYGF